MSTPLLSGMHLRDDPADSRRAANAARLEADTAAGRASARVEWTRTNIVRLIGLVSIVALALTVLAMCRLSASTLDTSTARGVANAYFAALQRGDSETAAELQCEGALYNIGGQEAVAEALGRIGPGAPAITLGPRYGHSSTDYFFDFVVPRSVRGTVSVGWCARSDRLGIDDFFDVQVWRE
jgi:hypothetical protein